MLPLPRLQEGSMFGSRKGEGTACGRYTSGSARAVVAVGVLLIFMFRAMAHPRRSNQTNPGLIGTFPPDAVFSRGWSDVRTAFRTGPDGDVEYDCNEPTSGSELDGARGDPRDEDSSSVDRSLEIDGYPRRTGTQAGLEWGFREFNVICILCSPCVPRIDLEGVTVCHSY